MRPAVTVVPDRSQLERLLRKHATVTLAADTERLSPGDRSALRHLIDAARWIDCIYWQQRSEFAWELKQQLASAPLDVPEELRHLINLSYGPWDVFDDDRPFWGSVRRPPSGSLYPADLTRDEFEQYLGAHPDQRESLLHSMTLVRRDGQRLAAVAYADKFRDLLGRAGAALLAASRQVSHDEFARFLARRADDLQTHVATAKSDVLWIDVGDSPIDIAIGAFEVYDDALLGLKRSYEATVMIRHGMTARLAEFETLVEDLAAVLPGAVVPARHRQRVVVGVYDVVYTAGSTNIGAKPIAAMLPNDERVRREHGSRLLLFRNLIAAKFAPILKPIAERLLSDTDVALVGEEAFVLHTLLHEMAHALVARPPGAEHSPTDERLRERYSTIEECRADLVALVFLHFLANRGVVRREMMAEAAATFVANSLRVLRFGHDNDYGRAATIVLAQLVRRDALSQAPDGRLGIRVDHALTALRELAARVQAIVTSGSYDDAGALLEELCTLPAAVAALLPRLADLPVDLELRFDESLTG